MKLDKYLINQLKERNGAEGISIDSLRERMIAKGFDLDEKHTTYDDISDIIYKEITELMINRNLNERDKLKEITIEDIYPIVRESVNHHAKVLYENGIEEEDVVQNVMIKAYNNWENFRGEARITTWVFRIVKNEVINLLIFQNRHKRKAAGTVSIEYEEFETEDGSGTLEDNLIYDELTEQVVSYVLSIDDEVERNVLDMFLEGFDNKTIAAEMGLKVTKVREILKPHQENIKEIIER